MADQTQTYIVTLSDGREVEFDANRQPTPAEALAYIREHPDVLKPKAPTLGEAAVGAAKSVVETGKDLAIGAAKGAGSTVKTLADFARAHDPTGFLALTDKAGKVQIGDTLEPTNTAQKIGKFGEQAAEYIIPAGAAENVALRLAPRAAAFIAEASPALAKAVPLVTSAAMQGAAAVPVAQVHGEDPRVAAVTGAALPIAAAGARGLGRSIVKTLAEPSYAALETMVGKDSAAKASKVIDTILNRRLYTAGKAQRLRASDEAEIQRLFSRSDPVTKAHEAVPKALDDLAARFEEGITPAERQAAVAAEREAVAAGPLGKDVVTGTQQVPTGILDASGNMITRSEDVIGRGMREDIKASEALNRARRESQFQRQGKDWLAQKAPPGEASKASQLALRESAKQARPAITAPLASEQALFEAERALRPLGPSGGGASARDMIGGKGMMILRLLEALGIGGGVATHQGGELLDNLITRALMDETGTKLAERRK